MLWYKSWMETRWRFLIGLALIVCSAAATVFAWPTVVKLVHTLPDINITTELGRRIQESAELSREYRGYVWSQWFSQNLTNMGTLFAVLLGTGSILGQSASGAALFTLSMPVSRVRLFGVRTATGLSEFLALAFIPSMLIPLLSPAVGKTYGLGDTLIHSACLFIAGSVFFSLAVLLSTVFNDIWTPLLISLAVAGVLGLCEQVVRELSNYGVFGVMSAQAYFRTGSPPWIGLLASAAVSAVMLYGAAMNLARRDF